jgi:hypothetical protein
MVGISSPYVVLQNSREICISDEGPESVGEVGLRGGYRELCLLGCSGSQSENDGCGVEFNGGGERESGTCICQATLGKSKVASHGERERIANTTRTAALYRRLTSNFEPASSCTLPLISDASNCLAN